MKRLLVPLVALLALFAVVAPAGADEPVAFWSGSAQYVGWPDRAGGHIAYTRDGVLELDAWQSAEAQWLYGNGPWFYVCPTGPARRVDVTRIIYGDWEGRFSVVYLADDWGRYLGSVYTDNAFAARFAAFGPGGLCVRWDLY